MYVLRLADWLSQGGTTILIETNKHAFILSPPPPQNLKVVTLIKGKKTLPAVSAHQLRLRACVRIAAIKPMDRPSKNVAGWLASGQCSAQHQKQKGRLYWWTWSKQPLRCSLYRPRPASTHCPTRKSRVPVAIAGAVPPRATHGAGAPRPSQATSGARASGAAAARATGFVWLPCLRLFANSHSLPH